MILDTGNQKVPTLGTSEFTNAAAGDFTLKSTALAIDAASPSGDCGAVQYDTSNLLRNPGMNGGMNG